MSKLPNVIFLDMDGVLCNPRACLAMGNIGGGFSYLDPIACMLVKRLCDECNAKLVISSAWRQVFTKEAMQAILNANCPNLGNYIWPSAQWWRTVTHVHTDDWQQTSDRGREIRNWIQNHETKFNNFVILDDMMDMRPLDDNLVKCNPYDGMSWQNYHDAEMLLKAEPVDKF